MSFEDYCLRAGIDPAAHLALSQSEQDLVEQPTGDWIGVGPSKIHGHGVFPLAWFSTGDTIGLLLDRQFRRTRILGRFINHADTPNTRLRHSPDEGFLLVAHEPIFGTDEITMDYYDTILLRRIVQEFGL